MAKFRSALAAQTHPTHGLGTGKSGDRFCPRRLGVWGLFLAFTPKKRGIKHGFDPCCSQRTEQLSRGQSVVLVVEVAEQEGVDGTPTAGWGCPWPPPHYLAPQGSLRGATAPGAAPAQQSWEPLAHAQAEPREWRCSRGACGAPGETQPQAMPTAGLHSQAGCCVAQARSAAGRATMHFIRSPFSFHSCGTFAPIVAISLLPRLL